MQLQQHQAELDELKVSVVVVTFELDPVAESYVRETGLPWPLLIDGDRKLYRAYGMDRGSTWSIFGPASWWAYLKLLFRGRKLKKSTGDVHQLGGDVLIDPTGVVRLHHVGSGPADRPSVQRLLDAIRSHAPSGNQ